MFSFASLLSLLTAAPKVVADAEALLASPAVQDLEKLIAANFTHTITAGSAAVIEPIGTTTNVGHSSHK